jgi:hypothetical protein
MKWIDWKIVNFNCFDYNWASRRLGEAFHAIFHSETDVGKLATFLFACLTGGFT